MMLLCRCLNYSFCNAVVLADCERLKSDVVQHERDFPGSGDRFDNTAIDSGKRTSTGIRSSLP